MTMDKKQCITCKQYKPLKDFYSTPSSADRRTKVCKECFPEYRCTTCHKIKDRSHFVNAINGKRTRVCDVCRSRRLNNTPEKRKKRQEYNRQTAYKLTPEEYDILLTRQGGLCAICKRSPGDHATYGVLAVDHDKETGKVRGLLCAQCNIGIGMLQHNPNLLNKAAEYLGFRDKEDM